MESRIKMAHHKLCKYCKNCFETDKSQSYSCPDCKEKNRKNKVMNNLFGSSVLFVAISE